MVSSLGAIDNNAVNIFCHGSWCSSVHILVGYITTKSYVYVLKVGVFFISHYHHFLKILALYLIVILICIFLMPNEVEQLLNDIWPPP